MSARQTIRVLRRELRVFPALLRVGLADAVAYRAEYLVWLLSTTMPLIMLALWTTVAAEAPYGRFGSADFVAYYLGAFVVRTLALAWVTWELNYEIRTGALSMRLMRPVHPLSVYLAEHVAAIPLRAALALPLATIFLVAVGGSRFASDPLQLALVLPAIVGAFLITFLAGVTIGSLAMFVEQSNSLAHIWFGLFGLLSGYLVPLELMPPWVARLADFLPFRYMLGYPVELMVGLLDRGAALRGFALQWAQVGLLWLLAARVWRAGLRRYEAYGS